MVAQSLDTRERPIHVSPSGPLNFRPIYDRHQGPYVLLLTRSDEKGKLFSDRITGSALRAQATHERAVQLIEQRDPTKTNVESVYVFSETEGQFTGALYNRGEAYAAWEALPMDDMPTTRPRGAGRAGTLPDVGREGTPEHILTPPAKAPRAKTPGSRFPTMRGKALVITTDPDAKWPASKPAQLVKAHFEAQGPAYSATSPELVATIGTALKDIGVEFPASLISRLKQAGLLREDAAKASTTPEENE